MNHKTLIEKLIAIGACSDAIKRIESASSVQSAYDMAYSRHLIWLVFKLDKTSEKWYTLKEIVERYLIQEDRGKMLLSMFDDMIYSGDISPIQEYGIQEGEWLSEFNEHIANSVLKIFRSAILERYGFYHTDIPVLAQYTVRFIADSDNGDVIRDNYSLKDLVALLEAV